MKNNLTQSRLLAVLTLIMILAVSCQDNNQDALRVEEVEDENFVNLESAQSIALSIEFPIGKSAKDKGLRKKGIKHVTKDLKRTLEVPDENGKTSFYIFNYEGGGFSILSADRRMKPLLAFSESDNFPMDEEVLPGGLIAWMMETSGVIKSLRNPKELDPKQRQGVSSIATESQWQLCPIQALVTPVEPGKNKRILPCEDDGGGGGCQNTYVNYGPLLSSSWGQRGGYNDLAPLLNCSDDAGGRAVTGCVATAIAQVMNYYESPSFYNWANMPDNSGTASTALLMRDVGDAVSMNWGCGNSGGSGASMNNVAGALVNTFGYTSASLSGYNHTTLKQQIRWNRPVILSGFMEENCFLWWCGYETGHAWVCDGYRSTTYCETGSTYTYIHMNWGWDGLHNSYYAYNNWNPGDFTFNENRKMVYNIRP